MNPIEGYEPPTLGGHKDHIVGVFFVPPQLAKAAEVRHERARTRARHKQQWQCLA